MVRSSPTSATKSRIGGAIVAAALSAIFIWAYWPTLVGLVKTWDRVPDYSHGFFVLPLALLILWMRRDQFPGLSARLAWSGLVLIAGSIAMRAFAAHYYLTAIEGWSILVWVGGVVWFLCGWQVFRWSLPSVLFLWFMVPLPFRLEHALSRPLQYAATHASCWILQCFGQPAIAENNIILLGDMTLEVEQACSGLRIFVGIVALAFVYFVLVRRAWWEKGILVLSIVPIALAANITRIVATALLFQRFGGSEAHDLIHNVAGYVMIPYAALLFAAVLWYVGALVQTASVVDVGNVAKRLRAEI